MRKERIRRIARLEKQELGEIPSHWSMAEQGGHLWRLLGDKGLDPARLYTVEYFPHRQCWLLTQEIEAGLRTRSISMAPPSEASRLFYSQLSAELRRAAVAAFAAVAARSTHFARFGCPYQLPAKPQETTPAELLRTLGGPTEEPPQVRFTSEGGWRPVSQKE
jgi:hypothetical protein